MLEIEDSYFGKFADGQIQEITTQAFFKLLQNHQEVFSRFFGIFIVLSQVVGHVSYLKKRPFDVKVSVKQNSYW
jgi:hypothetical protein